MRAAVISLESTSSKWTIDEMKKLFSKVDSLNIKHIEINFSGREAEILYKGKPIEKYDCVYVKGSFRYAALSSSITELLQGKAYVPIKADTFNIVHDKLLSQLKFQTHNLPMPRTYLSSTVVSAKEILGKVNYPIILKFPQGTQGKGVMYAESFASASSLLDALDSLNQPFLIQEYVETGGSDYRLIVVGDTVVASMERKASGDEKRANLHAGGSTNSFKPDELMKKMAIDCARAVHAEICGVDILRGAKGPVVIEANISPGLQGITEITKTNVAEKIAKHLFNRTEEFLGKKNKKDSDNIMKEVSNSNALDIISNLEFRGTRVLLPEMISKIAKLNEHDDYKIAAKKNELSIKKFM